MLEIDCVYKGDVRADSPDFRRGLRYAICVIDQIVVAVIVSS